MKPSSRFALTVSSFSIGTLLALQPLSLSAVSMGVTSAFAKGGGGEGGGGEGRGGGEGHGGGHGGGHSADKSDGSPSHSDRGKSDLAHGKSGVGQASDAQGRGEPKSILEGFLADIRGEKPSTRHEKTKATSDEKAAKTRESKTASVTQTAEVTTSKISLGKLNAAHAFMNGKTPNGAMNSTVGQLKAYITEVMNQMDLEEEKRDFAVAAQMLLDVANKPLSYEAVEAVNKMLGLDDEVEAQVVWDAVDKLQ
jgi:hypothetical protein